MVIIGYSINITDISHGRYKLTLYALVKVSATYKTNSLFPFLLALQRISGSNTSVSEKIGRSNIEPVKSGMRKFGFESRPGQSRKVFFQPEI